MGAQEGKEGGREGGEETRVNSQSEAVNGTDADHGSFQPLRVEAAACRVSQSVSHPTHYLQPRLCWFMYSGSGAGLASVT